MMRNNYLRCIHALFLCCLMTGATMEAHSGRFHQSILKATYDKPAKVWESEALPIGNGYMGAMVFGGVGVDVIQTNEHTVWSGGPAEDPAYNGGHLGTPETNKDYLHRTRVMLQQKMSDFTANRSAYKDETGKLITHNYDGDGTGTELRNLIDNLADAWKDGSFKDLKARGDFEVSAAWKDKKVTSIEILSNAGAECILKCPGAKELKVSGAKVKVLADDRISFATVKGKKYTVK